MKVVLILAGMIVGGAIGLGVGLLIWWIMWSLIVPDILSGFVAEGLLPAKLSFVQLCKLSIPSILASALKTAELLAKDA